VAGLGWYPCSRLKHNQFCFSLLHGYHPNPATPKLQHTSKQEHTTNVVIQWKSHRLLMMDVFMSEPCWAHKKWNKIASDMKLVFYSSTITMMHGPINIRKIRSKDHRFLLLVTFVTKDTTILNVEKWRDVNSSGRVATASKCKKQWHAETRGKNVDWCTVLKSDHMFTGTTDRIFQQTPLPLAVL